ncbi:MAG: hypothetical protein KAI71_01370 [Candidatus Pacebacteria bacterium]|nr:hypothetical protein [Candidatus Paceibacterota bacterium]
MNKNINKSIILVIIVFVTVSFTGCLNLASKIENEQEQISVNGHQGVFKSIDRGKTWEQKVDVIGGGFIDGIKIQNIKMDPQDHEILYIGTIANGLYRSLDGAQSWEKVVDENGILSPGATIYDIAIEKGNSDLMYIATLNNGRGELLKSEDGGKSWIDPYLISELNKPVYTVEIDPKNQNIVYIGTGQAGFLKSEDKALRWKTVTWFDHGISVNDIIIDFWNSDGIILRLSSGLVKSTDRGKTWDDLGMEVITSVPGINVAAISSITMHPTNPLIIYITYLNIVIVSHDGGSTWEKLNTITPSKTIIGTIPQIKKIGLIGGIVYYGAGNVLYKSEDAGLTWSSYAIPIRGDIRYTVSDYTNPDIIYVGSFYDPPPPPKKKGLFGLLTIK